MMPDSKIKVVEWVQLVCEHKAGSKVVISIIITDNY